LPPRGSGLTSPFSSTFRGRAAIRVGRRGAEGGDLTRFDREYREFHEAVREVYLGLARREPDRFTVLDATVPKPELAARVLGEVEPRLVRRRADGGLV
jgi:dTMP kinase